MMGHEVGVGGTTTTVNSVMLRQKQTYITNVNSEAGSFTVVVDPSTTRSSNSEYPMLAVWSREAIKGSLSWYFNTAPTGSAH